MIRYTLKCTDDHSFESWFASADAFDVLSKAGHVVCSACGSTEVTKTIMAPAVKGALTADQSTELAALRDKVEATSDYVGDNFATEARAIHDGEKPDRAIYGQANAQDAMKLVDDGIPVIPLPFMPRKRTN